MLGTLQSYDEVFVVVASSNGNVDFDVVPAAEYR